MRKLITLFCSTLFIFLTPISCSEFLNLSHIDPQDDCGFVLNPFFQRVSLKKGQKMTFFIHHSIPNEFHTSIRESIDWWNLALNQELLLVRTSTPENINPLAQDGHSVLSMKTEWDLKKPSEQARTLLYWSGDAITEADIVFNAKNFRFFNDTVDPNSRNSIHFTSLVIHEGGHAIGLDHKPNSNSVMYPFLKAGIPRLKLDAATKSSLNCEYSI